SQNFHDQKSAPGNQCLVALYGCAWRLCNRLQDVERSAQWETGIGSNKQFGIGFSGSIAGRKTILCQRRRKNEKDQIFHSY
ncbi:hypothetical protein, partial [Victivallis sp.]|uniref:hypothetical protein n=1 Tax=Victivallis sp. TaxID=2049020 RepID=UPI003A93A4AC